METSPPSPITSTSLSPNSNDTSSCVILFYKYLTLSPDRELMEPWKDATFRLCETLNLTGRILVGLSADEGINGTLAGSRSDLMVCVRAFLGRDAFANDRCRVDGDEFPRERIESACRAFWDASDVLSERGKIPKFRMDSMDDFKWSSVDADRGAPFPDLQVKLCKEIINTGGKLAGIPLEETNVGLMTPEEFHSSVDQSNTILIDCRNHKEYSIGHFEGAVNPKTQTFSQFPTWVDKNRSILSKKKVLMYCTGGIRCEKASAFIRKNTTATSVSHLKGGIHRYLETFGNDGKFQGKNFVFDKRGAHGAANDSDAIVVGRCLYCESPWDTFTPDGVCTVCREPTLVCPPCRKALSGEYHCHDHIHLKGCYFTNLGGYSTKELLGQSKELEQWMEKMAVGKEFKQKRKTLYKQWSRIQTALQQSQEQSDDAELKIGNAQNSSTVVCRNCAQSSCDGACWGFHGLKRKKQLVQQTAPPSQISTSPTALRRKKRQTASQRETKLRQKDQDIKDIQLLKLSAPPSTHRNPHTSLRCPPPCVRSLQSSVKGKWCNQTMVSVLTSQFAALTDESDIDELIRHGLIHLNDKPVSVEEFSTVTLKNMDVIRRIVHWHEPPVIVPHRIQVVKTPLSSSLFHDSTSDTTIYACNKPTTVPTHPSGPYLSNSLTFMVEAQEGLEPRSFIPCHRLDKCTSGLVLGCVDTNVARAVQGRMTVEGMVEKMYLARVKGKFPSTSTECDATLPNQPSANFCDWKWNDDAAVPFISVSAPIETLNSAKEGGVRVVSPGGKPSRSRFRCVLYDPASDASLVAAFPITGRTHQLRVHLAWLGHPICGDIIYGGGLPDGETQAAGRCVVDAAAATSAESAAPGTEPHAAAAREVCKICQDGVSGVEASFSDAQLLKGGHSIHLHAWKYILKLEEKRQGQGLSECEVVATEFVTDLPDWAKGLLEGGADIPWITDV